MSVKLGNTDINGLFLGGAAINQAYLGNTEIFSSAGGGPFGGNTSLSSKITNYWKMDTSGSFLDSVPTTGVDGTLFGATHIPTAKINGGYSFDTNDYINFNDTDFDTPSDFSVGGWVMFDTFGSTANTRFASKRDSGADGWMIIAKTSGKLRVDFYTGGGTYNTNSTPTTTLSTGVWYHLGFSYNNTTKLLQCYINGIPDGSVTVSGGSPRLNNITFKLARVLSSYFDGDLDEFFFANGSALSSTDWSDLYNGGSGLSY